MNVLVDIQQQKDFYNEYWDDYNPLSSYKLQRTVWIINTLVEIRGNLPSTEPKLLDLGCGDGRLSSFWKEVTGASVYALDLSPEAIKNARERYPFINYIEGDATKTPYGNNMFDTIICQEVIEHIEDQQQLINECSRILKQEGYLILTTPNKFYFDRREGGNYSKQPIENIIDKKQLVALLHSHFKILSFETLISAKGDYGIYKIITNRYLSGGLKKLGLLEIWNQFLWKKGYGLNMVIICKKK